MGEDTTIRVSNELADRLWDMKSRGESYEDVIWGLIEAQGGDSEPTAPADTETVTERTPDDRGAAVGDDDHDDAPQGDVDAEDIDVPGSGTTAEARREALTDMRDYLREHGTGTKNDLLELVDADRVGYSSADSFWSNCVKGKDTLHDLPNVEPPGEGGRTWRYVE